jgi:hypothetical protein
MESSVINILEILNKAKSLKAVGFSSEYNFTTERAERLFTEIVQDVDFDVPTFSGILILEHDENTLDYTVVDGLQRITTICLLLCALCNNIKSAPVKTPKNEQSRRKIFERYLACNNESKLVLAGHENKIYKKILFDQKLTEVDEASTLYVVYSMFFNKIKDGTISYSLLFKTIANVQFMTVFTPKSKVPLRELYQAVNGANDDLTQVRLITSYIKQISEDAEKLWQKTVEMYEVDGLSNILKYFIRDFLSTQSNGTAPDENNLYKSFNVYCKKMLKYQNVEQIITNMNKYASYYLKIIKSDFEDEEIQNQIVMINENNGQDAYSYLMEVLDDFDNKNISKEMFMELLGIINEFLVARMSNPDINPDFTSLSKELNMMIVQRTENPEEKGQIDLTKVKYVQTDMKKKKRKLTINEITQMSSFEV